VSTTNPTRFEPPASDAAEPFWAATRDEQLTLPWCQSCQQPFWFPRELCPRCLQQDIEWRPASGRGVVYSCSTMPKPANPMMAERVPYVVALIELEEGVRMMSNVVECDPAEVHVGQAVQVTWEQLSDGRNLPLFRPALSKED
jgi:uncharacterized OB-fold protein